jgi:hypothetical protein
MPHQRWDDVAGFARMNGDDPEGLFDRKENNKRIMP